MEKFKQLFSDFCTNDIDKTLQSFEQYYNELVDYNQKVNLTAITEKE